MEKLIKNSLGQWTLVKAAPKLKDMLDPYESRVGDPAHYFTGKDKLSQQKGVLKELSQEPLSHSKNMKNIETGKNELHLLVHHGIPDEHFDPKQGNSLGNTEHNNMDFRHPAYVDHKTFGVHTLSPSVADNYGDVHSFWVPISKFQGMRSKIDNRVKDKKQDIPSKYFEGKSYGNNQPKTADDIRNEYIDEPQSIEESHVSVEPGKYMHANKEDLQTVYAKGRKYFEDPSIIGQHKMRQRMGDFISFKGNIKTSKENADRFKEMMLKKDTVHVFHDSNGTQKIKSDKL